jgi:hypothetical protein
MQKFKSLLLTLLVVTTFIGITGCGDDEPDKSPIDQRCEEIGGASGKTWTASSITFESAPAAGFDNFSLTLNCSAKSYSATDGDPIFAATGTWDFNGGNVNELIFDGNEGNIFTISGLNTSSSPQTMTLTVDYIAPGGVANGVAGTDGRWIFNLESN